MKINVKHIAMLANLPLNKGEEEVFEKQLSEILTYVDRLSKIPTDHTQETSQSTGLENITREDISEPSLTQEEALSNALNKKDGMFIVPAILED